MKDAVLAWLDKLSNNKFFIVVPEQSKNFFDTQLFSSLIGAGAAIFGSTIALMGAIHISKKTMLKEDSVRIEQDKINKGQLATSAYSKLFRHADYIYSTSLTIDKCFYEKQLMGKFFKEPFQYVGPLIGGGPPMEPLKTEEIYFLMKKENFKLLEMVQDIENLAFHIQTLKGEYNKTIDSFYSWISGLEEINSSFTDDVFKAEIPPEYISRFDIYASTLNQALFGIISSIDSLGFKPFDAVHEYIKVAKSTPFGEHFPDYNPQLSNNNSDISLKREMYKAAVAAWR